MLTAAALFRWPMLFQAVFLASASLAECREYCWEIFNATCGHDEVVLMESARYGRMRVGRCLTREYYIGCSVDILQYVDRKCSGRHECQFDVPDTELHKVQPCPKDLMAYMEATYNCVKVADGRPKRCEHGKATLTGEVGYISNIITDETGLGSSKCPWVISVPRGQKINITLIDFAGGSQHTDSHICKMYATVREDSATNTDITVCGGVRRYKPIYLSETHEVQVEVMGSGQQLYADASPYFLLKYEAIGCPNMKAPDYGWAERKGDRLTISCNHTGEVWHLICNGNEWIGDFRNCSSVTAQSHGRTPTNNTLPLGLIVAVVIGIALGIGLGILLLGLALTCQKRLHRRPHGAVVLGPCREDPGSDKARIVCGSEYGYAHVWELQQLRRTPVDNADQALGVVKTNKSPNREPEFGQHLLLKCPNGNLKCKDHAYKSPRCVRHEIDVLNDLPPFYHEFDSDAQCQSMSGRQELSDVNDTN